MSDDHRDECSFCGRSFSDVDMIIPGPPGIHICNECVNVCNALVQKELRRTEEHGLVFDELPAPAQIKQQLDEYVVGQHHRCDSGLDPAYRLVEPLGENRDQQAQEDQISENRHHRGNRSLREALVVTQVTGIGEPQERPPDGFRRIREASAQTRS